MTPEVPASYSFDTSALIDGLERYYPEATFPGLWEHVDRVIDAGRLLISEEVWIEVDICDAPVRSWCTPRRDSILVPTDAATAGHVRAIVQQFPAWVADGRNSADPFVIAVALHRDATVVTGERKGSEAHPKIPYVCDALGVGCLTFLEFVQAEGWVF